jgi:hypothetical protein
MCYVGVVNSRVFETGKEAVECPSTIYGDNAACAFACATHKKAKTDVCSFLCIPGQHCGEQGRVHPISSASPGNFLPGCPRWENFEPVGDSELDCSSRCCTNDRCNANLASHHGVSHGLLTASVLLVLSVLYHSTRT